MKKVSTSVPEWEPLVNQSDPKALADFISCMPFASTLSHQEMCKVCDGASNLALAHSLRVLLRFGHLLVEHAEDFGETYYSYYGTHERYGNFAAFWSARGPGGGRRDRPSFIFWDGEPIWIGSGHAA